jgi:hypothetical protein
MLHIELLVELISSLLNHGEVVVGFPFYEHTDVYSCNFDQDPTSED